MSETMLRRRDRLARCLTDESLDALLISNPVNVTYLTGFTGDTSVLVLTRDRSLLVSDSRFTVQIEEECPGLETYIRPPTQKLPEAVGQTLGRLELRSIGFESGHLTVAEHEQLRGLLPTLDWKSATDRVELLRQVKDAGEIEELRYAIAVAERAFMAFLALLRSTDTEKDLADALEHYIRLAGGTAASFPPIVAGGERAALPHAPPTERVAASGDMLLVDWGAVGRLYRSDLTRVLDARTTAAFRDTQTASGKLDEVHAAVLEAQRRAIRAIRPGVAARDVDAAARTYLTEVGFGSAFGHGLGHGIGLQVHEGPAIRPNSDAMLEAGMVFTVEPGVYLADWGGVRIEDNVLVTPDGCEVLTHVPRELDRLRVFR